MHPARRLWRTTQLALLACLMMVHPLAGSGHAAGRTLAQWLSALQCVCEHCGTSDEVETASCCSEPAPAPTPACEDRCECKHADELPLNGETPLGTQRDGGGRDGMELGRAFERAASAAALAPLCVSGGAVSTVGSRMEDASPPGRAELLRPSGPEHGGLSADAARGPTAFLALLCIARI